MPPDGLWQPSNLLVPILHAAYNSGRLSASEPFDLQGLALEKCDAEYEAKDTWILRWTADISTNGKILNGPKASLRDYSNVSL